METNIFHDNLATKHFPCVKLGVCIVSYSPLAVERLEDLVDDVNEAVAGLVVCLDNPGDAGNTRHRDGRWQSNDRK